MNYKNKLTPAAKKKFSDLVEQHGWNDSVSLFTDQCDKRSIHILRNDIAKRYSNWVGLIELDSKIAIVIESDLGANIISLSRSHDIVYAIYIDDCTEFLVRSRLESLGITNVHHFNANNIEMIDDFELTPIIVAFNENNDPEIQYITKYFIKKYRQASLYYVCENSNVKKFTFDVNLNLNKIYYTGNTKNPFQLIESSQKRLEIGKFKYLIKNNLSNIFNDYVAITTLEYKNSFYEKLCFDICINLNVKSTDAIIHKLAISKPNGAILFVTINEKELIVRISFDKLSDERLARNEAALKRISSLDSTISPLLITDGCFNEINYTVEQRLVGINVKDSDISKYNNRQSIIKKSLDPISKLHDCTAELSVLNHDIYSQLIQAPIDTAKSLFPDKYIHIFSEISEYMHKMFFEKSIPLVTTHGDFSIDNIIVNQSQVTGIIDWDYSLKNGLPLTDILYFISSSYKREKGYSTQDLLFNTASQEIFNNDEKNYIATYCSDLGIDMGLIKPLGIMYAIYFIAYRLEQNEKYYYYRFYDDLFGDLLIKLHSFMENS